MSDESKKTDFKFSIEGFDPLGLKSAGEIAKETLGFGIDGAKEFLKLTCKPLLEELGLLMKDKIANWRLQNIVNMLEKAQGKLQYNPDMEKLVIDPRVAYQIVEHASIVSNDTLQDMWAGLFASSCHQYEEDENILFIDLLKRLTSSQVKFLNYLCTKSIKNTSIPFLKSSRESGLVSPGAVVIRYEEMCSIMQTDSKLKADTEFIALESMGLITEYVSNPSPVWALLQKSKSGLSQRIIPTIMAIRLFVKCQGSSETPYSYFTPQITDYHYQMIKSAIDITRENTLSFLCEESEKGESYKKDIEFGSKGFRIKNASWFAFSVDELNKRLRSFIIYRYIQGIDSEYMVETYCPNYGTFSYKTGIKLNSKINS
jgi:hypothetical protein